MRNSTATFPNPPAFLVGVPKSILRKLDAAAALLDALYARNERPAIGCFIALVSITSTLSAAKVQQRRIRRARQSIWKQPGVGRRGRTLFHDVHFYLICWARIAKLASFVARVTRFPRAKLVLKRYHSRLEQMSDFRDHLEHFEERLPGGSKHHVLKVPADLFNMAGDFATIGGERVNVGTESLRLLVAIVEEFKAAALFDALETLATADPTRVSHLVRRAALDVGMARTIKQVQKALRESSPAK
jgi:hypothetical protein